MFTSNRFHNLNFFAGLFSLNNVSETTVLSLFYILINTNTISKHFVLKYHLN